LQQDTYADHGSDGTQLDFESGRFVKGAGPFEVTFDVEVIGGGADGSVGVDRVSVHVLQNGVGVTLTGHYQDGGTAQPLPPGGLPVLDPNDDTSPFLWLKDQITVAPDQVSRRRGVWFGDAPEYFFRRVHRNTGSALMRVSGGYAFSMAVASTSAEAPNSIVVHAKLKWSTDFDGTNTMPGSELGRYQPTPNYQHTDGDKDFTRIDEAKGGLDAHAAGFETSGPRFNGHKNVKWTP
jgi:hypothetical protein